MIQRQSNNMWFLIKILVSMYLAIISILNFIAIFYNSREVVNFVLHSPFYLIAWGYLIITFCNEYKRDKELKEHENKESCNEQQMR